MKKVRLIIDLEFDESVYIEEELTKVGSILFYERDMEGVIVDNRKGI